MSRMDFVRGLLGMVLLLEALILPSGAMAAPVMQDEAVLAQPGVPMLQQFLPDGASVVTTPTAKACVVSRRIGIETSVYRDPDGQLVPFDRIIRSPATSVQAIAVAGQGASFRVQMKYSPTPSEAIELSLGGQSFDLRSMLEPSTDSLHITGDAAAALALAFRMGERPVLKAVSGATGRDVIDRLDAPDMAALDDCLATIADLRQPDGMVSNAVQVMFHADPKTTPLATLPDLKTCGMTDAPGRLHLARLEMVTGFFAHTDKIFVAFDENGALAQAYIPGIFDGDFRDGAHDVRLSRAANGNVPTETNTVKGCLGAAAIEICDYPLKDGGHMLGACFSPDRLGVSDPVTLGGGRTALPPVAGLFPNPSPPDSGIRITLPPLPPGGGGGLTPLPVGGGDGGDNGVVPYVPPPPAAVPLPASALLLGGALIGLWGWRRRKVAARG